MFKIPLITDPFRELLRGEVDYNCCCMCCKDAIERIRCNRPIIDACDCYLSISNEQCECMFCQVCISIRNSGKR